MSSQVLEGLAMLLQSQGVALYSADGPSSVFLDYLPERAEHALSLTVYAAEPEAPGRPITWPRVQVRARGDLKSPRWSRDKLTDVYWLLHGFRGELPNGTEVLFAHGLQSAPASLGPDAGGRFEHVLNFQLWVCVPVPVEASHASA